MKYLNPSKIKLSNSDIVILEYLNQRITSIPFIKIGELAKATNTSTSSIVRLSKKLGFKGFKELKATIIDDLNSQDNKLKKHLLITSYAESLRQLEICNDKSQYQKLAKVISKAKNVLFLGEGTSKLICDIASTLLLAKGYNSRAEYTSPLACEIFRTYQKNDVIIFVSYSGETKSILSLLKNVPKKIKTISITSANVNKLKSLSDYSLTVPIVERDFKHISKISRLTRIVALDILIDFVPEKTVT